MCADNTHFPLKREILEVRDRRDACPTVIRTSDGEIRWMDVSAYLKRESADGKTLRQIIFEGERFDAVSVQNWRKKVLK